MTYINRYIALSCVAASVLATSCVNEFEEGQVSVSGEGYYISLTGDVNEGGVESRAHWDINDDERKSPAFTWESTDKMQSFVWSNDAFVDFVGGQKYSATTVTPNADNKKQAQLQITTGLSQAYVQNDVIWAVSPLEDSNIGADNKVTFTLPDGFTQTALNSTEHLKDYVLMSGTGTVGSDNSTSISFNVLPAIYRFKVINNESEELTVNEVSITGPFCDKAELEYGKKPAYSVSNGTYAIKVATPEGGLKIAANETAYLYALVFPTETGLISENITLSFKGNYGDTSADYTKTAPCRNLYYNNINSNTYYDLEVPVSNPAYNDIFSFTADDNLKSLGYGQSYQIKYTNNGATITWSSSNEEIVAVDATTGMLKVNTLVGGDAKIIASVTKDGVSFTKTVDVTVAKGRLWYSFDKSYEPWYIRDGATAAIVDGKTRVTLYEKNKGAFALTCNSDKVNIIAMNTSYPILAIKVMLPYKYNVNNNNQGTFFLDTNNGRYMQYQSNGNNVFTVLKESEYNDNIPTTPMIIYMDLTNGFGGNDGKQTHYLPDASGYEELRTFQFGVYDYNKVADNLGYYDMYWVRSFKTVKELTEYVNNETSSSETASN